MAEYIKFKEEQPGHDYAKKIKLLRTDLGLTQQALADKLGVSFATVNRWENEQTKPLQLYWNQLCKLAAYHYSKGDQKAPKDPRPVLDFSASPEVVKVLAEGERLSFGHQASPAFATEFSRIDPLPHQRIAVYDFMLKQSRLRFLLADDAGAGKTIMTGLYIREMLSRRLLQRILIVTPAGLLGNWHRELKTLFNLHFLVLGGSDARTTNPFVGESSKCVIISMDTLTSPKVFSCLQEKETVPYDLVVFDEAHKLAADRGVDFYVRKTDRYRLAESLAGAPTNDPGWQLHWSAHHLLLLTATPHMGKDYPYYALWRLLEPEVFTTLESFNEFPADQKKYYFMRRTKEEMVYFDGRPLYPKRISDTFSFALTQGEVSEQKLYDETTVYLRHVYNRAKLLNREAARLALGVFQRRLASSTYALLCSFERRVAKLTEIIDNIIDGKITVEQLNVIQQRLAKEEKDIFDVKAADDETSSDGREENEIIEDELLKGVAALSLAELQAEKEQVNELIKLARRVYETGQEAKFERLRQFFSDPRYTGEKFIIFTEHRDTLEFLVKRLSGMGFTGQIARIHGGMPYPRREAEVQRFRISHAEGGARFLVCTDAAGEGINLQFCWIMINYDLPWNPARLEQRMGRIHRYGQKHDPVIILNLVASSTREGKVLKVLLDKLADIRKELDSDKVFDLIGRIFEGASLKQYMEMALTGNMEEAAAELEQCLAKHQIQSITDQERSIYGAGGDVYKELETIKKSLDQEVYHRLLPGYMRQYLRQAAPLVDLKIEGDMGSLFSLAPTRPGAMDPLLLALESYPEKAHGNFTIMRGVNGKSIWLHPGEPVFEQFRLMVRERLGRHGSRGAIFIDPLAEKPYLFHIALLSVVRRADPDLAALKKEEILTYRLIGIKQGEGSEIERCPVENLLLLRGARGLPPGGQRLAAMAETQLAMAEAYLTEQVARQMALENKKRLLNDVPERLSLINRGYAYQEAELAAARARLVVKARQGNKQAAHALEGIKKQQGLLKGRRDETMALFKRTPELVFPGEVSFIAHALVLPSFSEMDRERHQAKVELIAMRVARAFEEAHGAEVKDVHLPDLARNEGLPDNPGFDLLSTRPDGAQRAIEVKGRAGTGEVEVTTNEWARACNMRDGYWLYTVYDCVTPNPRLVRVQDPFGKLLAKAKGSVLIGVKEILQASAE